MHLKKPYSLFLLFFLFYTNIVLAGYPKTDRDFSLLPPFCKAKLKPSSPGEIKKWSRKLGPDFSHTHHYCAALHSLRIARSIFPTNKQQLQDKKGILQDVFNNIRYMEKHADPKYVLFPHMYTTKAEAYFEADRPGDAVEYLNKAIHANKKFSKPYALLADYYLKIGNTQEARKILQQGVKNAPRSKALKKRLRKLTKK